jgi:uncharacterized protein YndB with AHSA1/START domain
MPTEEEKGPPMKLTATEEIAAPIDAVWRHLTDFDRFESVIARRGGKAERLDDGPAGPGTRWAGAAELVGKVRTVEVTLRNMEAPTTLGADARTDGVDVTFDATLEALAPDRTLLVAVTEAAARSLGAKVVLGPLVLAHGRLEQQYRGRIAGFARRIEGASG